MLTLDTLAQTDAWPQERLEQLKGQCVGSLLKDWAANINRRWGNDAEKVVREGLGPEVSAILPADPTETIKLPAWLSVRTTDIVIASFLQGDALALEECLWEDTQRNSNAATSAMLRLAGPKMILKHANAIHSKIYDFGHVDADVTRRSATIHISGSPLFSNPTWQLTQLLAQRLLLRACHRQCTQLYAEAPTDTGLIVHVHWK